MGRRMIGTARRGHRDGNILLHIIIIHEQARACLTDSPAGGWAPLQESSAALSAFLWGVCV
jgi:hypothetical protein